MAQPHSTNVSQALDTALQELSLSPIERETYLLSLALGPLSVSDLAKKLDVQRPYLYTVIRSLREKGLAPQTPTGYQKSFVVESPTIVLSLLRKHRTALDSLASTVAAEMPTYLASYKQGSQTTQVLFYEGKEKFLKLYDRILEEEGKETLYFGEAEQFLSLIPEGHLHSWIQQRVAKKVRIRTLMIDSPLARTIPSDPEQYRETRYLPAEQAKNIPASFQVFGKSTIFWQPITPVAVVLQDEYIAQLHRGIFNLLWDLAAKA